MAFEQAQQGVRLGHLIVRDQLSICRYFASKVEYEADKNGQSKDQSKKKSTAKKVRTNKDSFDNDEFDEIFEEDKDHSRDLFYDDDDEKNSHEAQNESVDSTGNFQTEQAFYNNLEGSISIVERTGKLQK